MLGADHELKGPAIPAALDLGALRAKVQALRREVGRLEHAELARILAQADSPDPAAGLDPGRLQEIPPVLDSRERSQRSLEHLRDALSTRLMEIFRKRSSRGAFSLLYDLNCQHLLVQVATCLRRYASKSDPRDVLQEVFFNVYRYPHRFNCEREDAFRVWSAMIVRNTVLKHLRAQGRGGRAEVPFEDLSDQAEVRAPSPLGGAIDRESARECGRVYVTYLHLYLKFYSMLSQRERTAIHLVEVDDVSYRGAAERLGVKLENLKMVIFRARRKIHRSMSRVFDGLPPDCRPAREGARGAEAGMAGRMAGGVEDRTGGAAEPGAAKPLAAEPLNGDARAAAGARAGDQGTFDRSPAPNRDEAELNS